MSTQWDGILLKAKKSTLIVHWKDWCWRWSSSTLATWYEEWLIGDDLDAGKDWRQEEKRMSEDEMVGWHHWLNGHEFEQTLGDNEGLGSPACCSPWGCKESDMTERLIWSELIWSRLVITFLPRSKCLLILRLLSPSAGILEPRKIKLATVSSFPPCHTS